MKAFVGDLAPVVFFQRWHPPIYLCHVDFSGEYVGEPLSNRRRAILMEYEFYVSISTSTST